MPHNIISLDLKRKCVMAAENGLTYQQVYDEIFKKEHEGMTFESFRHVLKHWRNDQLADPLTQAAGTYPDFLAHAATVQVRGNGEIQQAWIKTKADDVNWDEIIERLQKAVTPIYIPRPPKIGNKMLEIPLFDLHFGVASLVDYKDHLERIVNIIGNRFYEEIHLIIGQDCIHTNDMRGHTAKGTDIGRVDIPTAWADAWHFWTEIIRAALHNSTQVIAHYSRGNHDECISWAFFKALEAAFPDVSWDDSLAHRKAFVWRGCFIGFGHMEYTNDPNKVFRDFVCEFPQEFADCPLREIHTGHLHRESVDAGVMIRRLASAVPSDEWSKANGFFGVHKRFQLFEYEENTLRAIRYV